MLVYLLFEGLYGVDWGRVGEASFGIFSCTQDTVESRDSGKSASWEVLGRSGVPGTSWEQGVDVLIS